MGTAATECLPGMCEAWVQSSALSLKKGEHVESSQHGARNTESIPCSHSMKGKIGQVAGAEWGHGRAWREEWAEETEWQILAESMEPALKARMEFPQRRDGKVSAAR